MKGPAGPSHQSGIEVCEYVYISSIHEFPCPNRTALLPRMNITAGRRVFEVETQSKRKSSSAAENDEHAPDPEYSSRRSPLKVSAHSTEPAKDASRNGDDSSEEEQIPRSPKKVAFADETAETSSRTTEVNGAARTSAKKGSNKCTVCRSLLSC